MSHSSTGIANSNNNNNSHSYGHGHGHSQNQSNQHPHGTDNDKSRNRGRFSWVRRLVMGPNRSVSNQSIHPVSNQTQNYNSSNINNSASDKNNYNNNNPINNNQNNNNNNNINNNKNNFGHNASNNGDNTQNNQNINNFSNVDNHSNNSKIINGNMNAESIHQNRLRSKNPTIRSHQSSNDYEDQRTTHSYYNDNVSTIPLKSLSSVSSKSNNSILNENANLNDGLSISGSTTDTSIAPSSMTNITGNTQFLNPIGNQQAQPIPHHQQLINLDRDSESIVTLASSSRRVKRRSLDTNCSTTGIAPASIMERLNVNSPSMNTTNNSSTNLAEADD